MYLLGIDLGTTGCKSILFSQNAEIISEAYIEYPLIRTVDGGIEQDAELWWRLVKDVVKQAVVNSCVEQKKIKALSISSQGISFVPVDIYGNVLYNALSWLDMRADKQADFIEKKIGKEEIFKRTGKRLSAGYSLPKMMWLKENFPEVYNKTWKLLMGLDFLMYKLTGSAITDHSMASGTMVYNIVDKSWDAEILEKCGIDIDKLPELDYMSRSVRKILPEVALEMNLSKETQVVLGAQDQKCAAIGAGINKGICTVSLGTASAISTICNEPLLDNEMRIPCFTLDSNCWILEAVIAAAGVSLKWMKNTLFKEKSHFEIDEAIQNVLPGSGGIFFYPHLEGATSPYWKPEARGFIYGLNISTEAGDILRALYEGIAYQIRANIEVMEQLCPKIQEIRIFGGGSKSAVWCKIIADVTGIPVNVLFTSETANLGAAIIAGVGIGVYKNFDSALSGINIIKKSYIPDKRSNEVYTEYYKKYCTIQNKNLE